MYPSRVAGGGAAAGSAGGALAATGADVFAFALLGVLCVLAGLVLARTATRRRTALAIAGTTPAADETTDGRR